MSNLDARSGPEAIHHYEPLDPPLSNLNANPDLEDIYHYEPLPTTTHIRVLTLLPSSERGRVCGTLPAVSLDQAVDYTALSYSWGMNETGNASFSHEVDIEGRRLPITRNLFECLLRLQTRNGPSRMWIDAVCINQKDVQERSRQVQMMAEIFSTASEVLVWLGEGSDEAEDTRAYDAIPCLACHRHWEDDHDPITLKSGLPSCSVMAPLAVRLPAVMPWNSNLIDLFITMTESIIPIVERRFFTRRWIVQEIYHGKRINLMWADHLITSETYSTSLSWLFRFATHVLDWPDEWDAAAHVHLCILLGRSEGPFHLRASACDTIGSEPRVTLLYGMEYRRGLQCSDARDLLYSILSLDPRHNIIADYSLPIRDLFVSLSRYCLDTGEFNILLRSSCTISGLGEVPLCNLDLPSWTPEWSHFQKQGHPLAFMPGAKIEDDGTLIFQVNIVRTLEDYMAYMGRTMGLGDILCAFTKEPPSCGSWDSLRIILPINGRFNTYRMIPIQSVEHTKWHDIKISLLQKDGKVVFGGSQWVRIV
ncbi:Heterokaryon incompatibility protein 6, OR allele [Fulvia fulva]|uniref:Heterokaryon incompatibility protein 6, OR allele n=1 Tax=Passalora fulva TaxID=5499 RepID=A0A9Q8UU38_PASFU|nr:Heterokaryon incompatibility protein 6, OR allele [Fulvia fulva]KAK4627933.1 Heterokaryon incompatibility protein 6, OR allele [Fulvia fulva]UJO22511.1 Heterokaryon incompatibility protein 6, OR allele [Fulvia fulva]